jgi:ribonuclease-3
VPKRRDTALQQFFERLGFAFKESRWSSLRSPMPARGLVKPNEDNERLEFLGDRVLGLAVAELLTELSEASEGSLPPLQSARARRDLRRHRAKMGARTAHRMSGGGSEQRPRQETLLANACEAVLSASSSRRLSAARDVVYRFWVSGLSGLVSPARRKVDPQEGRKAGHRCRAMSNRPRRT